MRHPLKYILVLLSFISQLGTSATVIIDGMDRGCEKIDLHQELPVYKDPSLFLRNTEENPLLGTFVGEVKLQQLGEPTPFKNLSFFSRLHPMADLEGKDQWIIPVRMCDQAYRDTMGFVIATDFKKAQQEVYRQGYMPPSTASNPIPTLPKQELSIYP